MFTGPPTREGLPGTSSRWVGRMSRGRRRADRIREEIPIVQVLADYGYAVFPEGGDREQQFSCDLHGDGHDTKPSARVYPDSASFYCFACGQTRDAITLVREKEGVGFGDALKMLEARYGLPALPWEAGDSWESLSKKVEGALHSGPDVEETRRRVERFVLELTREKSLTMEKSAALWEAFDKVAYLHQKESIDDRQADVLFLKILRSAKEVLGVGQAK